MIILIVLINMHIYVRNQWRNYGPAGPAAAGGPGEKGPIFKPYKARWGIGAHFCDPAGQCGGPKFEVTPRTVRNIHLMTVLK